jgi:hypothetical protein
VSTRLCITITYFDIIFIDPSYVLLPPCNEDCIPRSLIQKIILCLATRFDLTTNDISPHLQTASLRQYGKVRRVDGGDVMSASSVVAMGDDRRDATFVRVSVGFLLVIVVSWQCQYEMLVDRNARYARRPVVLDSQIFFGQLQHIFVVSLPASLPLRLQQRTTIILAAIRTCSNLRMQSDNGMHYYSREGHLEVVDMECVQCLVGRVKDGNEWAIVDRSEGCARPVFATEEI